MLYYTVKELTHLRFKIFVWLKILFVIFFIGIVVVIVTWVKGIGIVCLFVLFLGRNGLLLFVVVCVYVDPYLDVGLLEKASASIVQYLNIKVLTLNMKLLNGLVDGFLLWLTFKISCHIWFPYYFLFFLAFLAASLAAFAFSSSILLSFS